MLRYEDEDGDLITIRDDADISHAISLSSLFKLTINDKVTHPVVLPIEHLSQKLVGMDEKQTVAAVTAALVDLQDRIGKALQVIQSQHPTAAAILYGSGTAVGGEKDNVRRANGTGGAGGVAESGMTKIAVLDSKPLVLSAESL
ncbi:hypothetical protein BGZ58_001271, partial [Dissophora ornata]